MLSFLPSEGQVDSSKELTLGFSDRVSVVSFSGSGLDLLVGVLGIRVNSKSTNVRSSGGSL